MAQNSADAFRRLSQGFKEIGYAGPGYVGTRSIWFQPRMSPLTAAMRWPNRNCFSWHPHAASRVPESGERRGGLGPPCRCRLGGNVRLVGAVLQSAKRGPDKARGFKRPGLRETWTSQKDVPGHPVTFASISCLSAGPGFAPPPCTM